MKKCMYIVFTILMIAFCRMEAKAQYYYTGDSKVINGFNPELGDIDGSPFWSDKWILGSVTNTNGVTFNNVRLKYDVLDDQIIFAGTNDELMAFPEKIKAFTLGHNIFANGFPPVDTLSNNAYYQVLAAGKATLLKHVTKSIQKTNIYGFAVPKVSFAVSETWYLYKNNKMVRVEPNGKSLLNALSDSKAEMQEFLKNNKNEKKEPQLAMLVTFYNNLR